MNIYKELKKQYDDAKIVQSAAKERNEADRIVLDQATKDFEDSKRLLLNYDTVIQLLLEAMFVVNDPLKDHSIKE